MLVNYDDSSESENENEPQQKEEKVVEQKIQEQQKKKVKLLNFNQVMKKADEKSSISSTSSYTSNLLNEAKKIDTQLNNEINSKRKLPKDYEDKIECPVEQKYHKLNIKEEELQKRKIEEETVNEVNKQNETKGKQKKHLFIPPQARNNQKNVSTEF